MIVIFDVDGTLLGGEAHDWAAFDHALGEVLGFTHAPGFFAGLTDVTAESIVEAAAAFCGREAPDSIKEQVRSAYLRRLRMAHDTYPDAFSVRAGVRSVLKYIAAMPGMRIGIATGDWLPTISFKLQCAGLDVSAYPMGTSSDAPRRADIVKLAAARAGGDLADVIYIGDGVWDLRACREIGVRFIGTGARTQKLRDAGATCICEPLAVDSFLATLRDISGPIDPDVRALNGRSPPLDVLRNA